MKISPKQYALSLYQAIAEKKEAGIKVIIKNFLNLLVKNNDLAKSQAVIKQLVIIWNKEEKFIEAEIISAKELDHKLVEAIENYLIEFTKAKKVALTAKIDKKLLGGLIIKYNDKIIDGSLKTRLAELKEKMSK